MKHDKVIRHTYYVMYMNTRRAKLIVKDRAIQNETCFVIHLFCNVHALFHVKFEKNLTIIITTLAQTAKKLGTFCQTGQQIVWLICTYTCLT